MPVGDFMNIIGIIIALGVLVFLIAALTYLIAPQSLDRVMRSMGIRRGIGVFTAANVFKALSRLAGIMILLGVLTIAMVIFQSWPRGWLIPAAQELVMAVILFVVGYLGSKGRPPGNRPGPSR
ncbi:MAG: hypothetical protein WCY67_06110 [Acidithiobacillus sp.]